MTSNSASPGFKGGLDCPADIGVVRQGCLLAHHPIRTAMLQHIQVDPDCWVLSRSVNIVNNLLRFPLQIAFLDDQAMIRFLLDRNALCLGSPAPFVRLMDSGAFGQTQAGPLWVWAFTHPDVSLGENGLKIG
jgi:hypothetical protein